MPSDPPPWVRDAVFYQIFPDRFASSARVHKPGPLEAWDAPPTVDGFKGGDLLGIVEHLDHLERLGITAISLNPIFASAANHRYHTYDYRSVDPLLGGNGALRELLDTAHARGMRVVLDGVFNHASRGFWPFNHVMENGAASPYVDWFYFNPEWLAAGRQVRAYDSGAAQASMSTGWGFVHAAGVESLETLGYRAWWDLPALPKLNTTNPEVREFIFGIAEDWIRFGADGWRLDVASEIDTPGFWEEFRERVRAVNPDAYILAENWEERPQLLDGTTFDALMNYPLLVAADGYAAGRRLDHRVVSRHDWLMRHIVPLDGPGFASRLAHISALYRPAAREALLNLIDGHDTPRLLSMAGGDTDAVRLATLIQMTVPGAPCIYYGDEIGMAGEMDPLNRAAFPWDEAVWDRDLMEFVRAAVALRHQLAVLRRGELRVLGSANGGIAYLRILAEHDAPDETAVGPTAAVVALNNDDRRVSLQVEVPELAGQELCPAMLPGLMSEAALRVDAAGRFDLSVGPRSGLVLQSSTDG
jgi:cyclomaltodextrinase / maltogenic alpha-amylase / neopullulanase